MKIFITQPKMKNKFDKAQLTKISIEYAAVDNFWKIYTRENNYIDNRQRCNIIIKHSFAVACRNHTNLSLSEIGGVIDKDHSLVVHASKNHDANYKYLRNYDRIYNDIKRGLIKHLNYETDVSEADDLKTVSELRDRLIKTSKRLRNKIIELNNVYESEALKPIRLQEENEFLKKHNRQIYERNKKLEKELARVKNLI